MASGPRSSTKRLGWFGQFVDRPIHNRMSLGVECKLAHLRHPPHPAVHVCGRATSDYWDLHQYSQSSEFARLDLLLTAQLPIRRYLLRIYFTRRRSAVHYKQHLIVSTLPKYMWGRHMSCMYRIAIADDDHVDRTLLKYSLTYAGHEIAFEASSGEESDPAMRGQATRTS